MTKRSVLLLLLSCFLLAPFLFLFSDVKLTDLTQTLEVFVSESSKNTFLLLSLSCLWACFWAIPAAYFQSHFQFKFSKVLKTSLLLPLAFPVYILAYTYKGIFGAFGSSHQLFSFFFEIDQLIYLSFIFSFALFPYLYLILLNHFRYQNPHYIEASQSLGKSLTISVLKIRFPLMLPALFAGLSIISMEILNNFGAVSYFGISTFTTEIVRFWNPIHAGKSISIALALLVTVGLFFFFENRYKNKKQSTEQNIQSDIQKSNLKTKHQVLVVFWICIPLFFGFILPFIQLIYWAFQDLSFLFSEELISLTINTLKFSSVTIICCLLSAFAYMYFVRFYPKNIHRNLAKWSTLGYAFPGVLVAIAVLQFGSSLQIFGIELKNILSFLLIFAYIIRFQSIALNSMLSSAEKSPLVLHEASQSLGYSRWQSIKKIEWPLLKPSIWSAALLIFVELSKELPLTIMFQQFNFETLAIHAYQLMITDGAIYQAALPSLIIVLLGLLPLWLIKKLL